MHLFADLEPTKVTLGSIQIQPEMVWISYDEQGPFQHRSGVRTEFLAWIDVALHHRSGDRRP